MTSFNNLQITPQILKGVYAAGFSEPFPIQKQAIGFLLEGSDVIGQARTGTGKTAAYGIPLLQTIDVQNSQVQALVLSPTRELAVQIAKDISDLGKYASTKVLPIYGGQSINIQLEALTRGVHAIVGTPGRVIDHIKRGTLRLGSVRFVVLDEADTMLEMGFVDDVEFILDSMSNDRQLSFFSATMPPRIIGLSERYMRNPERILIDSDEPSVDTLDQYYAVVKQEAKLPILMDILAKEKPLSTMIFCRTKHRTRKLARELAHHLDVVSLHGDLSQHQRDESMRRFRSGHTAVLVATDVASRGIDIRQVDCVINYEVPENPLLYFHRVGRTARAGDSGRSFTIVSYEDFNDFARILSLTKATIKPLRPEDAEHSFNALPSEYNNKHDNYRRFRSVDSQNYSRDRWEEGW